MSALGMTWARSIIRAFPNLDWSCIAVLLHLGERDQAELRTDRGIASHFGKPRNSVRLATAKLAALGVISRASPSGPWALVDPSSVCNDAPQVSAPAHAGEGNSMAPPRAIELAPKGQLSGPLRKKNPETASRPKRGDAVSGGNWTQAAVPPLRPRPSRVAVERIAAALHPFDWWRVREGLTLRTPFGDFGPGSPEFEQLRAVMPSEGLQ